MAKTNQGGYEKRFSNVYHVTGRISKILSRAGLGRTYKDGSCRWEDYYALIFALYCVVFVKGIKGWNEMRWMGARMRRLSLRLAGIEEANEKRFRKELEGVEQRRRRESETRKALGKCVHTGELDCDFLISRFG